MLITECCCDVSHEGFTLVAGTAVVASVRQPEREHTALLDEPGSVLIGVYRWRRPGRWFRAQRREEILDHRCGLHVDSGYAVGVREFFERAYSRVDVSEPTADIASHTA